MKLQNTVLSETIIKIVILPADHFTSEYLDTLHDNSDNLDYVIKDNLIYIVSNVLQYKYHKFNSDLFLNPNLEQFITKYQDVLSYGIGEYLVKVVLEDKEYEFESAFGSVKRTTYIINSISLLFGANVNDSLFVSKQ